MNDKQKDFIELLEGVTPELFTKFLDEKKVTAVCPMCKHVGQIIPETFKTSLADILQAKNASLEDVLENKITRTSFVTFYRHYPAQQHGADHDTNYYYKVNCENCGFVSMYTATMVLNWLAERNKDNKEPQSEG